MEALIERWRRAAQRAADEKVRVLKIDGEYWATSTSRPLGSYRLTRSDRGWTCDCTANRQYGMPCKHLWVFAEQIGLDLLTDVQIAVEQFSITPGAA